MPFMFSSLDHFDESSPLTSVTGENDTLTIRGPISVVNADIVNDKIRQGTLNFENCAEVEISGVACLDAEDRVLSVTGSAPGVAKAYYSILSHLLPEPRTEPEASPPAITTIRLLVSEKYVCILMQNCGKTVRTIEDASGAHLTVHMQVLPPSPVRVLSIQGTAVAIGEAVELIGRDLLETFTNDGDEDDETVIFQPKFAVKAKEESAQPSTQSTHKEPNTILSGHMDLDRQQLSSAQIKEDLISNPTPLSSSEQEQTRSPTSLPLETRKIYIPDDMVGYVLGRNKGNISWIRRTADAKINFSSRPTPKGERAVKIVGTTEAVAKAVFLIERRVHKAVRARDRGEARPDSRAAQEEDRLASEAAMG